MRLRKLFHSPYVRCFSVSWVTCEDIKGAIAPLQLRQNAHYSDIVLQIFNQ